MIKKTIIDIIKTLINSKYLFIITGNRFAVEIGYSEKVKLGEEHKVIYLYYDGNLSSDKKFQIQDNIYADYCGKKLH